jgi:hypothetical protein
MYANFNVGNLYSDSRTAISMTKYSPEISENLSTRSCPDISSLASLLFDIWHLLIDTEKSMFKGLLEKLSESGALCHEDLVQFQLWIKMLKMNGHVMRAQVILKALHTISTPLTVQQTDASVYSDLPSYLYSSIYRQPIEKSFKQVVEGQQNTSSVSTDNVSEGCMALVINVHSASSGQGTSETRRNMDNKSQGNFTALTTKLLRPDSGNAATAPTQILLPVENIHEEMVDCSQSSRSKDIPSSCAVKGLPPSAGTQRAFSDSGIGSELDLSSTMSHKSFLETDNRKLT